MMDTPQPLTLEVTQGQEVTGLLDYDKTFKRKERWGGRHTLVALGFLLTVFQCTQRFNTSIAIVSMVGRGGGGSHNTHNNHSHSSNVCPSSDNLTTSTQEDMKEGEFAWDESTQGLILGAFFYGSTISNPPGGRLAERCGAKPVVLVGMLLSSVLTILSPLAVRLSTNLFIAVRLGIGLAQGVIMPAVNRFMISWVPPFKRSKYNTIIYTGNEIGIVIALSLGGWLCDQTFLGGWPAVFYVFGSLGLVWCLAWGILVTERPENHTRISQHEKNYLLKECTLKKGKMPVIPWRRVFTSLPMWAIIIMHIGNNWGWYTFVSELPIYLSNIHNFSIRSNGLVSALPYVFKSSVAVLFSLLVDRATSSGRLSIVAVRRLAMIVASFIPAVGLVVLCFVGCQRVIALVVLCVVVGATGTAFCGVFSSHQDISPHFSGTLYGITNSIANTTGFIAPALVGFITLDNQTVGAWNIVFIISALIAVVTCTFYIVFISANIQPFNNPQANESRNNNDC